ncbi:MAG: gamma-glutamyltransferase family protein [Spirochaetia bacterium]
MKSTLSKTYILILSLLIFILSPVSGDEQYAAVTSHYLATESAVRVLEAGGTAADAAVAVAAVLSVVEGYFSHIMGGGVWALYYDAESDDVIAVDGVGPVPQAASLEFFQSQEAQADGIHWAIVPGAWSGWIQLLEEYGTKDLSFLLEDAIRVAEEGFQITAEARRFLGYDSDNIPNWEYSREIYMDDNGDIVNEGDTVYQRRIAETFREAAAAFDSARDQGYNAALQAAHDYVYEGPVAESIVEYSDENDGFFTMEDFSDFEAQLVEPISIQYRDTTVYQNPPNSQGITQLIALNILEGFNFSHWNIDTPEAVHVQVEAVKLAHADKYFHIGDPEFVDNPIELLLSEEHASRQRQRINMNHAIQWPFVDILDLSLIDETERLPERALRHMRRVSGNFDESNHHTTTYHIVDQYGNGIAVTTSLGAQFLVAGDTGVHINHRIRHMWLEERNPNTVAPGKLPRHTSNPYIAFRNGGLYILGGNTGVDTQPQGQVQQFINMHEFGLTPQEAAAYPRWVTRAFPQTNAPYRAENVLAMESETPRLLRRALRRMGHEIVDNAIYGMANIIRVNEDGSIQTGADPRFPESRGTIRPEDNE